MMGTGSPHPSKVTSNHSSYRIDPSWKTQSEKEPCTSCQLRIIHCWHVAMLFLLAEKCIVSWQDDYSPMARRSQLHTNPSIFPSTLFCNQLLPVLAFQMEVFLAVGVREITIRKEKAIKHTIPTQCAQAIGADTHHHSLRPIVGGDLWDTHARGYPSSPLHFSSFHTFVRSPNWGGESQRKLVLKKLLKCKVLLHSWNISDN